MEPRRTLLCVHPHPDDESIACGGVLARAAGQGDRTVVVTCTGGEEGENLADIDLSGEDLVTHRRRELAAALERLGVHEHVDLGYRDSGMVGLPSNEHPDSFHAAGLQEAATRLATVLRRVRPDVVVSDDHRGTYGHPDHVKAYHVTVQAVTMAADPDADVPGEPWSVPKRYVHTLTRTRLWRVHRALADAGLASPFGDADVASADDLPFGTDDAVVTTVVDVRPWLETKRAALAAHRTQIGPDSFFLNTPDELAGPLFGTEEFVLESGTPGPDLVEDDLFAGLSGAGSDLTTARTDPAGSVAASRDAPAVAADRFRSVLSRFATGVCVMTAVADGAPHGMTASSVTSVSLDPPLVLVCVDRSAVMAELVEVAGAFALTVLAADQRTLADRFADPKRPAGQAQFTDVATVTATTGAPVLEGGTGWVDARVWAIYGGGDHLIVVGEVVDLGEGSSLAPLLHHRGSYDQLSGGA